MTERWTHLFRPVDAAGPAAFRVLFGCVMFGAMVRLFTSGWLSPLLVEPTFHFKYPGFGWVPAPSEQGAYLLAGGLAALALCIAAGFFYRLSAALFAVGFTWLELVDVTNYLNHYYLVALLAALMPWLPLHRAFSVDAWLRPSTRGAHVPAWVLYLLRFQVGVVYVNAGLAKLTLDWLWHAQPMGIWLAARTETPVLGPLFALPATAWAFSWTGFLFDLTIVLWLSWGRTRPLAYTAVVAFHALTSVLFDIGIFPVLMTALALVFFPADWPRRLCGASPVLVLAPTPLRPRHAMAVTALLVAWCGVQVAVPLRHHAYRGDVLWHEEGMRFSWKVMVREKRGSVTFHVRDPQSGRKWQVTPGRYLTQRQEVEMSGQPDLILQLAHHVGQDHARILGRTPEVRAEAWVSLNGRAPALLLDPSVDLMAHRPTLGRATWIRPAPEGPPLPASPPGRGGVEVAARAARKDAR
jgi:vitamin K-dependent gamma-carboxylase